MLNIYVKFLISLLKWIKLIFLHIWKFEVQLQLHAFIWASNFWGPDAYQNEHWFLLFFFIELLNCLCAWKRGSALYTCTLLFFHNESSISSLCIHAFWCAKFNCLCLIQPHSTIQPNDGYDNKNNNLTLWYEFPYCIF